MADQTHPSFDWLWSTDFPIFSGRYDAKRATLSVGVLDSPSRLKGLRQHAVDRGLRLKIRRHTAANLRRARSLEQLLAMTGEGELVFDRTKALERSEQLLQLAQTIRQKIGSNLDGLYFQADRRILFVVLNDVSVRGPADGVRKQLAALMACVEQASADWRAGSGLRGFDIAVRVGYSTPDALGLIAVDRLTARRAFVRALRASSKGGAVKLLLGALMGATIAAPAMAAGPAVEAPNISILTRSGVVNDKVNFQHLWAGLGVKGAIPLGEQFGAQLDVGVGTDAYYGAAGHLFARDPDMGLIGLLFSAESRYGIVMTRLGVEGEFYLDDKLSLGGIAGFQGGTAPNGAFGKLDLKFYPDPNFMLKAGLELQPTVAYARAGFEWQPAADSLPGLSLYGDASYGSNGDYRALFGLNFQIGASGSLVDRHRRSDPEIGIFNEFDVSKAAAKGTGYAS